MNRVSHFSKLDNTKKRLKKISMDEEKVLFTFKYLFLYLHTSDHSPRISPKGVEILENFVLESLKMSMSSEKGFGDFIFYVIFSLQQIYCQELQRIVLLKSHLAQRRHSNGGECSSIL